MRRRYGVALSASVLRPLGEQVVAELDLAAASVACDLMCDGGVLTAALARTIRPFGTVVAVDTDLELATDAAETLLGVSKVVPRMSDGSSVPLDDASCDVVASLATLVFTDHRFLLGDVSRVLRRGGRAALLVWDDEQPPVFVTTLRDALQDEGITSRFLDRLLAPVSPPRSARVRGVRDVYRAETAAHAWAAMLDSPLAVDLAALPDATVDAARKRYTALLEPFAEADGTLRIPIHARIITLTARE
ncbi:MAG: class I SAM-dependent methyltransferase [Candidatus Dormibacteria bacterium]